MMIARPFLCLALALAVIAPAAAQSPAPTTPPGTTSGTMSMMKAKQAQQALLDINTASEDQLKAMKGVGDVRAKAIIKGRPYKGKDELVQRSILPQKVYDGIKDKIIAKQK